MVTSINVEPIADPAARLLGPNPTIRERLRLGTKHCRFVPYERASANCRI
jgi:hypothetical protein